MIDNLTDAKRISVNMSLSKLLGFPNARRILAIKIANNISVINL